MLTFMLVWIHSFTTSWLSSNIMRYLLLQWTTDLILCGMRRASLTLSTPNWLSSDLWFRTRTCLETPTSSARPHSPSSVLSQVCVLCDYNVWLIDWLIRKYPFFPYLTTVFPHVLYTPMYSTHPHFSPKRARKRLYLCIVRTKSWPPNSLAFWGFWRPPVTNIGQITCHKQSRGC